MSQAAPPPVRLFPEIPIRVRRDRIRGQMGYPPDAKISGSILGRIEGLIDRFLPLARPAGMYRIYCVQDLAPRRVTVEGGISFSGAVREYLGKIDRLAVFIATAGGEIYRQAQEELRSGRAMEGMVANAVGSEAADCATEEVVARIREEAGAEGRAITLPYSPGYCGMDIREQAAIFAALDGGAIGVRLLPSFIMSPVKSVSGIIGMGPPAGIVATGSPCERCEKEDCMMRRYA